ncbi:MAG: ABC transporter permease [Lachnospiraceae bacterium]|nr:ABC transporter permease [Lachnospiraceae bacterium]
MKKYISFFRLRFSMGLQYRTAALAGIATQFAWGALEVLAFRAFYETDPNSFPMSLSATCTYVWLQQAFLALFAAWLMDNELLESIINGNIAYELCRPVHIYDMWFSKSAANRISRAVLRSVPILLIAAFLPAPYGLSLPAGPGYFLLFLLTLLLGLAVTVSFCMLVHVLAFFTISPRGLQMIFVSAADFFSGGIIPLPFFPPKVQFVLELFPFASMQNVPLRIYSGSMTEPEIVKAFGLQIFWLLLLLAGGRKLCRYGEQKVTIQGG